MPSPVMRSKLFVPGTRAELFDKAFDSAADALSFDLEDSVVPERKAEARARVAGVFAGPSARDSHKLLIVRVNPLASGLFEADVAAVARPGLDLLNLSKPETPADVFAAVAALERAEALNGVTRPIGLLVNIETPGALRHAAEIAAAHPRVVGLQLGLGDLFEPLGIARDDAANVHAVMFALRLAAGSAGVFCCDAAFANLQDLPGFEAEARMAQRLGFIGKSCIHPSQIAVANTVFGIGAGALAAAQRVLDAARDTSQRGAFVVDGRMIDAPFLARARAIVEAANATERRKP